MRLLKPRAIVPDMQPSRNAQNQGEMSISKSTSKLKILFVITKAELGGAYMFLVRLLEQLDHSLFEIHVALGTDGDPSLVKLLPPETHPHLIPHLVREIRPLQDMRAIRELTGVLNEVKPNILFLNSSKAGFIGSVAAKFLHSTLPLMKVVYRIVVGLLMTLGQIGRKFFIETLSDGVPLGKILLS